MIFLKLIYAANIVVGGLIGVTSSFIRKLSSYSLRMMPRWGKVRIMKIVMGGIKKHQRTIKAGMA